MRQVLGAFHAQQNRRMPLLLEVVSVTARFPGILR
ncbi:MAG: hypothetical protein ACI9SE_004552 [Neolewinella sp.]|jgi:hypothetical protein